jgi:hypothetical protein
MNKINPLKNPLLTVLVCLGLLVSFSGVSAADGPAVAKITSPVYDSNHTLGDNVYFTGNVHDSRGAAIADAQLVWISSLDGRIGTGFSVTTSKLSMGIHLITLNATDKSGKVIGTDAIKIKVRYVNKNQGAESTGVIGIGETGGEGYVVNPMY